MLENSPFDYQFHKAAISELLRVCTKEIRIYPLQGAGAAQQHLYLQPLIEEFDTPSLKVELQPVAQRDIIGAEQMMIISRK